MPVVLKTSLVSVELMDLWLCLNTFQADLHHHLNKVSLMSAY